MPFIQFQKYIIYLYENRYGYYKHKSKEKTSIWEGKTGVGVRRGCTGPSIPCGWNFFLKNTWNKYVKMLSFVKTG